MATTHYLSIIRKVEFIDLFKYGHLNIYSAIKFDGNIENHANDNVLFENLTKGMNLYEYSFEYLIIHISRKESSSAFPFSVNISSFPCKGKGERLSGDA